MTKIRRDACHFCGNSVDDEHALIEERVDQWRGETLHVVLRFCSYEHALAFEELRKDREAANA